MIWAAAIAAMLAIGFTATFEYRQMQSRARSPRRRGGAADRGRQVEYDAR